MAVEIKELVIRATTGDAPRETGKQRSALTAEEQERIVSACVKEILKILQRKKAR